MKIVLLIVRMVLSLRYKVFITWEEHLKHDGPVFILPNHVALIDPRILLSTLSRYIKVSPVASELYYNKPVLKQVMDLVGTVPIWEMTKWADAETVKKVFQQIVDALKNGKNILIYPSGQLYRQWFESIKWKQSAYHICNLMPENTKIIWIRTNWLWWSIWSKSWDNGDTGFWKAYLRSIWYVLANLIFFVPKRKISIELQDITKDIHTYRKKTLNEFNIFLETFYNKDGEEKISYLPHYFYYNDVKGRKKPRIITWSEEQLNMVEEHDISNIDKNTIKQIQKKISEIKSIQVSEISDNSKLILDLYFDSLDTAEIKSYIQANFSWASNSPITDLKTVSDLYIMAIWESRNEEELKKSEWSFSWDKKESNLYEEIKKWEKFENIWILWKYSFKKNKWDSYMWDNIFGIQRKRDFIIKAYLISNYLKKIPGDYISIMLPSVWSASIIIIATYLAGKVPVMFNWTLWKESFDHCVKFSKVDKILTSSNFFDRVKNDFLEEYLIDENDREDKQGFVFLEELLKNVSLGDKLIALSKSIYMPSPPPSPLPSKEGEQKGQSIAVILFTSGSESLPKAVPLTHKNIIENIRWSLDVFELQINDRLLGFLPPFHSFWFTINTIMPLITWLPVVYTPDPNDAKTVLNVIKHTDITSITATPTFLKMIMNLASQDDFKNIRYVVVWAEKCSSEVFDRFKELAPQGKILEWYGITECSPVLTINPVEWAKRGTVWKFIPNLDYKIVDIDTKEEVPDGEQGMIYVSWSSVFDGYLDKKIENPFEEIQGKSYYKTGDLWLVDSDWFLTITGRLKRFIKIAWEMISLPFVEWILIEKYGKSDELNIAIEAIEKVGEVKIVLFSTSSIAQEEVNNHLREKWVSNLVKISEVQVLDEIPVLWTGKIDYKELKKLISFHENIERKTYNFSNIDETLKKKVSELSGESLSKIKKESIFGKDIILDSIDVWELMIFIRKHYKIEWEIEVQKIKKYADLEALVNKRKNI